MSGAGQPILRWAGSKRQLLPALMQYSATSNCRYIEPFVGSGQLYFNAAYDRYLINDINPHLMNMYRCVRDNAARVVAEYSPLPVTQQMYYEIRHAFNFEQLDAYQHAAFFIYLNRNCYNGLYRTNTSGAFNVPFGPLKNGQLPKLDELEACAKRLRKTQIESSDFYDFVDSSARKGDFVYLDPPYAKARKRTDQHYMAGSFMPTDLERVSSLLDRLDRRGAKFLLSYAYALDVFDLMDEWSTRLVTVQRNISGFAMHRRKAVEVLITNVRIG